MEKKIIAKVDNEVIYKWQLEDAMQSYSLEVLKKNLDELTSQELTLAQQEAIEKLIGSTLFYLEAVEAGIEVDENEVNKNVLDFIKNFRDSLDFEVYLAERGLTKDAFKDYLKKTLIKEKFVNMLLKKIPPVTKKEADKYYEKIKEKLSLPPRLTFYRVYIENPDLDERKRFKSAFSSLESKKLEQLFAERIVKDTPSLIARTKYEEYIEKSIDEVNYDIVRKLLATEEGFFTPIFETNEHIEIFYLIAKVMHIPVSEEEGKKEAGKYLAIVRLKKILDAYIDVLKEKRKIEIYL
jgi:hypothetical protein